jgi:hypothetical protein
VHLTSAAGREQKEEMKCKRLQRDDDKSYFFFFMFFLYQNENMPPCKNSSSGYYTGREPSPKGLGYCAHSEGMGTRRIGNDGNMWITQQDRLGRMAWKKYAGPSRRTPGTPKRRKTSGTPKKRNTPKTPKRRTPCRPGQIFNPRTNRCVSKYGKIGHELRHEYGGDLWTKRRQNKYPTARRTESLLRRNGYNTQNISEEELDPLFRYWFDGVN